jgi:hypothetical protein
MKRGVFKRMLHHHAFGVMVMLVLFAASVIAVNQKIILNKGESQVVNGKNITFLGVVGEAANVRVDGDFGKIQKGSSKFINGVDIHLAGLSTSPAVAILNVTVLFNCGDKNCETTKGEGPNICCKDCGCIPSARACVNNVCVENVTLPGAVYQCQTDSDCAVPSEALCTQATCDKTVIPYRCKLRQITLCSDKDNCCPFGCTEKNDLDCSKVAQCIKAEDCDDGNPCTTEKCEGIPKKCASSSIKGCVVNDECLHFGAIRQIKYCDASGTMKFIKEKGLPCTERYECLTGICRRSFCAEPFGENMFFYGALGIIILCISIVAFYVYEAIKKKAQK